MIQDTNAGFSNTVAAGFANIIKLLDHEKGNKKSKAVFIDDAEITVGAIIEGVGSVVATVDWYGLYTNDNDDGELYATSKLSGTDSDSTTLTIANAYAYHYCILYGNTTDGTVTAAIGH